jgi:hypothetical protein
MNLMVRVPSPVGAQSRIEQAIIRRFLEQFPDHERISSPAPAAGS